MMSALSKREVVETTKNDIAEVIALHLQRKRTQIIVFKEALKRAYPVTYEAELAKINSRVEELLAQNDKERGRSTD